MADGDTTMGPTIIGQTPMAISVKFPGGFEFGISEAGMKNLKDLGMFILLGGMIYFTMSDGVSVSLEAIKGDMDEITESAAGMRVDFDKYVVIFERAALALEKTANNGGVSH